jgi:hypothetical protein
LRLSNITITSGSPVSRSVGLLSEIEGSRDSWLPWQKSQSQVSISLEMVRAEEDQLSKKRAAFFSGRVGWMRNNPHPPLPTGANVTAEQVNDANIQRMRQDDP